MKYKYLIFDFDGTIADTALEAFSILNDLSVKYKFKTLKKCDIKKVKSLQSKDVIKYLNISMWKLPFILFLVRKRLKNRMEEINICKENYRDVLFELKEKGLKLGILTSNSKKNVNRFLKNHNIDLFDYIYTSSSLWGKNKKLLKLEKNGSINIKESLYIGDETRDINSAKKIGMDVAAVTWGYNSRMALKKQNPNYIINDPKELIELIELL